MEYGIDLVLMLAAALATALLCGLVANRLKLSPIVGYLVAGVAVGSLTPGFVGHRELSNELSQLGVVLLMFGVGMNLRPDELLRVRRVALPGALLAMTAAGASGFAVASAFGWSTAACAAFGLAISVTSTVVLVRLFADRELLHTRAGHVAIGWLLVEDLVVVLALIVLPVFAAVPDKNGAIAHLAVAVALALAKIGALVLITLFVGRRAIPRLLALVARTRSRELFTLSILVIALGLAIFATRLFGASLALGAFLAGIVVGQSDFGSRAASEALPMRDAFAVLFFVATGMLLEPREIVPQLGVTLATLAAVLFAKPLVAFVVMRVFRYPTKPALAVAVGLGQIGEFSFVVAAVAARLGVLPRTAVQSLVATSIIAIMLSPISLRLLDVVLRRIGARRAASTRAPASVEMRPSEHRVIVVGYGPIGRCLVDLLFEQGLKPTVVEINHETAAVLRARGIDVVYGDASRREILERAGVGSAESFIFTASGTCDAAIRTARSLKPDLLIFARAAYLREEEELLHAGASAVVDAESEIAFAMVERLLAILGATPEQLDHARERVRRDVRAAAPPAP
jgi:CPA2 family monovalent cation:H+ antiporter-2